MQESFEDASESTPRPDSSGNADTDDETHLNGGVDGAADTPKSSRMDGRPILKPTQSQQSPSRDRSKSPTKTSPRRQSPTRTMSGLSGALSPVNSPPPPSSKDRQLSLDDRNGDEHIPSPPTSAGFARKASSGFGALLGRMGTIRKSARSPSHDGQFERRGTVTTMNSVDSSIWGSSLGDGIEGASSRPSLRDQFSNLRRQQEYNTEDIDEEGGKGEEDNEADRQKSRTQSNASARRPSSPMKRSEDTTKGRSRTSSTLKSSTASAVLPPGTASGISAGPSEEPRAVNWDLWQQVVYEGPAAVARTSGDELSQAIASGIPAAIRGVVWQVLADSKNEELESIYRLLKTRGTDADQRPPTTRARPDAELNGTIFDKDRAHSDASSEHSDHSATPQSGAASSQLSVESSGLDLQTKVTAEKQRQEAVTLQKLEKTIKRDLGSRTSYSKYAQSPGLQDGLFGVCKAYALFDEGVGYAQGMNFIAMPLLFNMSEEEAFTLLVKLMSKYDLRSMFTAEMTGLHLRLYQFDRLLEDFDPAVYCHLKRRNVSPQLYATQWFLTLFAYRFPLQLVLRVYDLIFSQGLTAILKFGIVLMQRNREALLEMKDMSQLCTFLKERIFDVYSDKSPSASSVLDSGFFGSVSGGADKELYRADQMVRDACQIHISDDSLAAYTHEWEESQRLEHERETEIETLRTGNVALSAKVKGLEERVQQHDAEHVVMAQDLVKVKVENDSLQDANEGLKVQVAELQKLVDAQPAELEARLKEEMDRIMNRNIEVQNENRHLKEEMDEMEHELVNAKMAHAQVSICFAFEIGWGGGGGGGTDLLLLRILLTFGGKHRLNPITKP